MPLPATTPARPYLRFRGRSKLAALSPDIIDKLRRSIAHLDTGTRSPEIVAAQVRAILKQAGVDPNDAVITLIRSLRKP